MGVSVPTGGETGCSSMYRRGDGVLQYIQEGRRSAPVHIGGEMGCSSTYRRGDEVLQYVQEGRW